MHILTHILSHTHNLTDTHAPTHGCKHRDAHARTLTHSHTKGDTCIHIHTYMCSQIPTHAQTCIITHLQVHGNQIPDHMIIKEWERGEGKRDREMERPGDRERLRSSERDWQRQWQEERDGKRQRKREMERENDAADPAPLWLSVITGTSRLSLRRQRTAKSLLGWLNCGSPPRGRALPTPKQTKPPSCLHRDPLGLYLTLYNI